MLNNYTNQTILTVILATCKIHSFRRLILEAYAERILVEVRS